MDNCIDKFLVNFKQGNIEKHSDSSDFDETQLTPRLSAKGGKHSLLNKDLDSGSKAKRKVSQVSYKPSDKIQQMHTNSAIYDNIPVHDHDAPNQKCKRIHKKESNISHNKGDELLDKRTINSKNIQPKAIPCFSNILRRANNCTKQISSIKDIPQDNLDNGKASCPDCERRRIKKLNRCRQSYVVQPVYAVDNIQGGPVPFGHANDRAPLSQHIHKATRKQDSNTSYELTSSESENGNKYQRKHVNHRRNFIERFQKEMRKEYIKYEKELIRNRVQQYPSKRDNNSPYQVFSSPYCQIMNAGAARGSEQSNIPSTSSGFWEYLFEKIRGKRQSEKDDASKPCYCTEDSRSPPNPSSAQQKGPCSPENCANYDGKPEENTYNNLKNYIPECKSCMQQTDDTSKESSNKTLRKSGAQSGKNGAQNVKCKCYSNKKRKQTDASKNSRKSNSQKSLTQNEDVSRPCQEPHDDLTRTIEEKYNGEILCIHNPPCILINGCLNLPGSERPLVQGNLWPVTQDKKSSFYHICRKMNRPKNNCEQASQYHPPSIEVQRAMQIKAEKLVQSICNHDPPCEVVYGCYKAKYDPKLDNSCVHVPMCERLPQCLIEERQESNAKDSKVGKLCEHKPKCTEVPLCSRKFVVLTAKDTVGTQVRPKTKLVCRHEPPCIMIPKCLARIIADSYIPYEAIPDCVHQPCCDMIPACCRKAAKDMVSVSSQYPNAPCRIV